MEVQHFSHEEHPLTFVEELQNDEVVCSGCKKSVCGPAYKCSQCNFFLHRSCAELPREIVLPREIQHYAHPNHTLVLQMKSHHEICDGCGRHFEERFFYRCSGCDLCLDIECASILLTKPEDCHQHDFTPIFQQVQFTCKLCGEDCAGAAQICRICLHLAHTLCALKPRTLEIVADPHLLTLIYSLGQVIKEHHNDVFCNFCAKKVNLNYAGYYCQQCAFVAHLNCACPDSTGVFDAEHSSKDSTEGINLEMGEEREELKHFDHEHNLIITRNEVEVHHNKLCEGCMQSIFVPFYSCEQCNYFLHSTCARLPLKKRHTSHSSLLTLSARGTYVFDLKYCEACYRFNHGFAFTCHQCKWSLDIRCCSIPKTFRHEGHEHFLFQAIRSTEKCNACGWLNNKCGVFACTKCDFSLCYGCATLPLKAKHEHDLHRLTLTSTAENDSGEYYCLICEEERSQNYWFYYCEECNFAAHPRCVVGKHPYIKYGRNFTQKDHQHPLNLVRRTKESHPCNACSETFDEDLAVNCSECKSFTHPSSKCLDYLRIK